MNLEMNFPVKIMTEIWIQEFVITDGFIGIVWIANMQNVHFVFLLYTQGLTTHANVRIIVCSVWKQKVWQISRDQVHSCALFILQCCCTAQRFLPVCWYLDDYLHDSNLITYQVTMIDYAWNDQSVLI